MTQATNKKDSIYAQLLRLLLVSAFAAVVAFWGLELAGEYLVNKYLEETDYIDRKNQEYIEKFQNYIRQEQLSSRDTDALNIWLKKQKLLSVKIYKDEIQVFDSNYPDQEIWEEEISAGNYAWESYYIVEFSDGLAEVIITGVYSYQFYNYVLIAELIVSFTLFLLFVLLGIRRKMDYIRMLSSEIEILEGGSLDYPITVKGKDELAALAEGLDELEEPEQYEVLFYDIFSETCSYLEQKGFSVAFHVSWMDSFIRISTDYVMRILDNVTSNIVKYADTSEPVEISSVKEFRMVGFMFENKIRELKEKVESTGIGIQNIKNMMKQMGGKCIVEKDKDYFRIMFLFPKVDRYEDSLNDF